MRLTSFLPVTLLCEAFDLAEASSIPKHKPAARADDSVWKVSDFKTGCSPGGCVYYFNIVGAPGPDVPGFNTTCSGTDEQTQYQPCSDPQVSTNITADVYLVWTVDVMHQWVVDNQYYSQFWDLGQANVTSSTRSFEIQISQHYGVS